MQLGQEKQIELNNFLCESFEKFVWDKKLSPKKVILIHEYTKFLMNKISGKTK